MDRFLGSETPHGGQLLQWFLWYTVSDHKATERIGSSEYDLVAWIFSRAAVETDITSVESAAKAMNQMRRDFIFYKRAYEDTSQNPLWQYMLEYFAGRYTKEALRLLGTDTLDAQTGYSIRLYCYGTVGMTREWLLSDNKIGRAHV